MTRFRRIGITAATIALAASLLGGQFAFASLPPHPDLWIRSGAATDFIGMDIINDTGAGQTWTRQAARGDSDRWVIRLQNDGFSYSSFSFSQIVEDPKGFKVTYTAKQGGKAPAPSGGNATWIDVTNAVKSGQFQSDCIFPGEWHDLRVTIKATKNTQRGDKAVVAMQSEFIDYCGDAPQPEGPTPIVDVVVAKLAIVGPADAQGAAPRR